MGDWAALIISIIIPNLGGIVIGLIVSKNIPWYNNLKQPSFRPPNWLFGVAWTILYTLMGVSSYLIYEDGGFSQNAVPLGIYAGNVVLNWLWSVIFFGCHLIMLGFFELVLVLASAIVTAVFFYPVNQISCFLLIPYMAWCTFAGLLNFAIWSLNGPGPSFQRKKKTAEMQEMK